MPADTRVFGMNILPSVDQQGLGEVAKEVKEALSSGVLDSKVIRSFGDMAKSSATEFNKTIAKAKLAGLDAAADNWREKMLKTKSMLFGKMKEMAEAKVKFEEAGDKEGYALFQRKMKEELEHQDLKIAKDMKAIDTLLDKQTKAKDLWGSKKSLSETGGTIAEGFASSVDDMWSNIKAKDLGGVTRALSGALGKASKGAESAGAAGVGGESAAAMASTLATAAAAVAAVAAVVVAIGAIVKVMIDADSQAKEFNSTLLQGASHADFFSQSSTEGIEGITESLTDARTAAMWLALEFRGDTKEIMGVLSAANAAGLTFKEMQAAVGGNVTELEAYTKIARTAIVYSKTLGQSQETIATQTAEWMHDLGGGLATVESGFNAVFQGAMQSGIGVKRFYGFITAATSNMALYNMRIEEAAALVSTLGKSLGEANAASFTEGLSKGFAADSYTERFKKLIIAGKADRTEIFENAAVRTAKTFQEKFGADLPQAMEEVLDGTGVDLGKALSGDASELKKLGAMNAKDQRALLQATEGDDQYRELAKLVELSRGMSDNIGEQAKSLDAFSPTDTLAMILTSGLGGKDIADMSGIDLAAFEGYAGQSGEQLLELRKVAQLMRGQYEALEGARASGDTASKAQLKKLDDLGMELRDGQIYIKDTNEVIDSYNDYVQSQGDVLKAAIPKDIMTKQEQMSKQVVQNTESILNSLDTGMIIMLEKIYQVMSQLLGWASGMNETERAAKTELLSQLESEEKSLMESLQKNAEQIIKAKDDLDNAKGSGRIDAERKLSALQEKKGAFESEILVKREEQKRGQQLQGGYLDNWNGVGEMRDFVTLSGMDRSKIQGGVASGVTSENAEKTATNRVDFWAERWAKSAFREAGQGADLSEDQLGAVANTKKALASQRGVSVGEIADFDPIIQSMKDAFMQQNIRTEFATEIDEGKIVEWNGVLLPAKKVEELKAKREKTIEQVTQEEIAGGFNRTLETVGMSPEEILAEATAAAAAAQSITTEQQTKDFSADQAQEFDELKKKFPSLTEEGFFAALQRKDLTDLATAAAGTGGPDAVQAIMETLQREGAGGLSASQALNAKVAGQQALLSRQGYVDKTLAGNEDFIYRGGAMGGTITSINRADELLGAKPGGPVDQALKGGGGNRFTFNINGGNTQEVYAVIKKALRESGVRPPPGVG